MPRMKSAGNNSIRVSKKRRHSQGSEVTPKSEKAELTHKTIPHSATLNRKRKRSDDGGSGDLKATSTLGLHSHELSAETPIHKRPQVKPPLDSSIVPQDSGRSSTAAPGISVLPGQKVALLSTIRQRLAELDRRMLYVRKLPKNTTLAHLKTLCPTSINARLRNSLSLNRRKHAFIEFKSEEAARAALQSVTGKLIADRMIKVVLCAERSTTSGPSNSTADVVEKQWAKPDQRQLLEFSLVSLYVCCIPRSASPDEVRQLFPKAVSFDFNMHPKGKGIGSCRVAFSSQQDALESFQSQHGTTIGNCPIIVNFAFKKNKGRLLEGENSSAQPDAKGMQTSAAASTKSGNKKSKKPKASIPAESPGRSTVKPKNEFSLVKRKQKKLSSNEFPIPKQPKAKRSKVA